MDKSTPEKRNGHPYCIQYGEICRRKPDEENGFPLCNFTAQIIKEIALDDGYQVTRRYQIAGRLAEGVQLPDATVDATEYLEPLKWIARDWGARAIVSSGSHYDLREAIQQLSTPEHHSLYTHTGWREIDGRQVYLHQGGAVGISGVSVQLDAPLDRAQLPEKVEEPTEAIRCSLKVLDCGPARVTIPLLGAIYLAPLASILEPDFALYLTGPTGSFKSELAALGQQHFGRFDRKHLPASWSSTENAIEAILFTLKDMLAVVDDFAPQANRQQQQRQQQVADRVLRSVGNRAPRARLRADLSRHADRPPRSLVLITGEQLPEGASINARLVVVEVNREEIDKNALSRAQEITARFPHAMRAYLEWLAPKIDSIKDELERSKSEIRDWFRGVGGHMRQPESLSLLALGVACFLGCAEELEAINPDEADRIWETACKALSEIGHREAEHLREGDPADVYLRTVATLRTQGAVSLRPKEDTTQTGIQLSLGEHIGWQDKEHLYLLPDASRKAVVSFLYKAGEHWPTDTRALGKLLQNRGYLVIGADGRPQKQVRVLGERHRVFQIPQRYLSGDDKETDTVQKQDLSVSAVPKRPKLSVTGNESNPG